MHHGIKTDCNFTPKNMQAPAMFETSERGCEPPVSVNRQISSPTKKNEDDGEMQLLPFLS